MSGTYSRVSLYGVLKYAVVGAFLDVPEGSCPAKGRHATRCSIHIIPHAAASHKTLAWHIDTVLTDTTTHLHWSGACNDMLFLALLCFQG